MSSRELAIRRNDTTGLLDIEQQIISLGGDPLTGDLMEVGGGQTSSKSKSSGGGGGSGMEGMSEYDQRIHKINENNRRKTKEAMANAHAASLARKKAEEAIIKAKAKYVFSPRSSSPLTIRSVCPRN